MYSIRPLPRAAARSLRAPRLTQHRCRFQSTSATGTTASSSSSSASSSSSHFAAGVAGGVAGASILYGIYYMTPSGRIARKINKAANEADRKYQQAAATLQEKTPSTDQAVGKVKEFCYAYVSWVPGGRQYVDAAFRDFDAVREQHGEDVDRLVAEAYAKFRDISQSGLSLESVSKAYDALADLGQKLAKLAGSAADQLLDQHPQLKDKVGGPIDQLRRMGQQYGPEARKMVDETWEQIAQVMSGGASADNIDKVRRIIEDKSDKLRQLGDRVWHKAVEQAQPYLDRNPQVKKLVMDNQETLKQGDASALLSRIKAAVEGGKMADLEEYVRKAVDKAKSSSLVQNSSSRSNGSASSAAGFASLGKLLGTSSQDAGGKIREDMEVLSQIVNHHAPEAKELLEETRDELKRVLENKAKKAREIVNNAQKDK